MNRGLGILRSARAIAVLERLSAFCAALMAVNELLIASFDAVIASNARSTSSMRGVDLAGDFFSDQLSKLRRAHGGTSSRKATATVLLLAAAACGETPTSPSPVVAEPTYATEVPLTFTLRPDVAQEILRLTNEARARGGMCGERWMPPVRRLTWDARLAAAAERHVLDMAEHDEFGHTGTDGSTPQSRAQDAGYPDRASENFTSGANPAAFYGADFDNVAGWLDSPGHCRNLMNAQWRHLGAARVDTTGGSDWHRYNRRWWMHKVQMFGSPR